MAILAEGGFQAGQLLPRDRDARELVVLEVPRATLAVGHVDGGDLPCQKARGHRPAGQLLAAVVPVVHGLAGVTEAGRQVLGRVAHPFSGEGAAVDAVQPADELERPALRAPADLVGQAGHTRMVLAAGCHRNLAVAGLDLLRRADDGLRSGAAGAPRPARR